ncbi:MAG: ribosome-binding factor A [Candidatus Berkelbacteria bacterium Licking1014_85]|uniref:Ribosome-binding factor A n=1 Tax=Candidatus Berkelbacteria bacterium Licking1014_85 TaxID=2017148 RepID=A0A554LLV3_9BACT|nr:MAG: ribosome-binding factor A [Candidatus Berkelbacteria bacterium Licking1014_85]
MNSKRMNRVNSAIHKELSLILSEEGMENNLMITITSVDTNSDLREAKVYIEALSRVDEAVLILNKRKPYFQSLLAKRIKMKFTPVLNFIKDTTGENVDKILDIIDKNE